jgi:hypothetical protein
MLYFHEVPMHFGLTIASSIFTLLLVLLGIIGLVQHKNGLSFTALFGTLTMLFGFLALLTLALSMFLLPAAATVSQLLPYYQCMWTFVGLHGFFLVYYLYWRSFKERLWLNILPILGTISYLTVVWVLVNPLIAFVVSDGVLNYVVMPLTLIAYGGILAIIYIFLIPFYYALTEYKIRVGAVRFWSWMSWLCLFLWFIGALMVALVQYTVFYMLYILGLITFAWFLGFIAMVMFQRASAKQTKQS